MSTLPKTLVELYAEPKRWIRREWATDRYGKSVPVSSENAFCFCLLGACDRIHPGDKGVIAAVLEQVLIRWPKMAGLHIPDRSLITYFNDSSTLDEIREVVADAHV